jgi:hypothetical protein
MYIPKVSVPKPQHVFKIGKTFSSTKSDLQVQSSLGTSKVPSVVSGDLEETVDLNDSFKNNSAPSSKALKKALLGDNPMFYFQFFFFYLSLGSYYGNNLSLSFLFCCCAKRSL